MKISNSVNEQIFLDEVFLGVIMINCYNKKVIMQLCNYYQRQVQLPVNLLITFADVFLDDKCQESHWKYVKTVVITTFTSFNIALLQIFA